MAQFISVADYLRFFCRDRDTLKHELVVEPEIPVSGVTLEFELDEFGFGAMQGDFFSSRELHAHGSRGTLAGIHGAELSALLERAFDLPVLLFAGGSQELPGQDLAVNEEVVIEDASRG